MSASLRVNEIFHSLQGEGLRTGRPCAFVRLTGCNLRCAWCDTPYAWDQGRDMSVEAVLAEMAAFNCPLVEVTGGEPLLQPQTPALLTSLCDSGYETLLETNGSLDITGLDPRVVRIVDFKCPSSGQADSNRWSNVEALTASDEVKFVLADRADYEFARAACTQHDLPARCPVTLGCADGQLAPGELAQWILDDALDLRLGLQLHRILWPAKDRGV